MIRRRILLGTLLAALFVVGWTAGRVRASGDLYRSLDLFVEVLHAVQTNYVDPVEPGPLIEGGMRGMLKELDPYSQYLDPREYDEMQSRLAGQFDGVGLLVDTHEGYPIVVAPIEGSPAWEQGVMPGDILLRIDGKIAYGLGIPEVSKRLRGAAGTKVTVSIVREGDSEERDVTITRRRIETPAVPHAFLVAPGVGYLRLANFTEKAGSEVAAALDTLRAAGARKLVLDLRGNPGGLVNQAVAVAQQFVPEGSLIVYTKGRAASVGKKFTAGKARTETAWPMVVLVDGGSASASEIVTGALQDLDRALVLGSTSFGKGSVQDVYPLRNRGGALKLTTGLYYTASGRSLQKPRKGMPTFDDAAEDEDAPEDAAAPESVATEKPQEFRTGMGRVVFGGGGITPDLEVKPDSLAPVVRLLESRRALLRFVSSWSTGHPDATGTSEEEWTEFRRFALAETSAVAAGELDPQRGALTGLLQREHARRLGSAAAARVVLDRDPVVRRALVVLHDARVARDVFAKSRPMSAASPSSAPRRLPSPHGKPGAR
ncbi:MAG: S41 family peptidase [Candidatus Eisenbacteria bacterium]